MNDQPISTIDAAQSATEIAVASTASGVAANPWADQRERMKLEEAGKVVHWNYGWSFTVRRKGTWNKDFQGAGARVFARDDVAAFRLRVSGRRYKQTASDAAFWNKTLIEIFVEGCLVGWEGVTNKDGSPLPFTRQNAIEVLTYFRDLYTLLNATSEDEASFEPEYVPSEAAVAGN